MEKNGHGHATAQGDGKMDVGNRKLSGKLVAVRWLVQVSFCGAMHATKAARLDRPTRLCRALE